MGKWGEMGKWKNRKIEENDCWSVGNRVFLGICHWLRIIVLLYYCCIIAVLLLCYYCWLYYCVRRPRLTTVIPYTAFISSHTTTPCSCCCILHSTPIRRGSLPSRCCTTGSWGTSSSRLLSARTGLLYGLCPSPSPTNGSLAGPLDASTRR